MGKGEKRTPVKIKYISTKALHKKQKPNNKKKYYLK